MIGFFYYLCSTDLVPHWFYVLLGAFALLLLYQRKIDKVTVLAFLLISLITALSALNILFHLNEASYGASRSILVFFPYSAFILISLTVAKTLKANDLKIVLYLILLEIFIGLIEFWYGQPTFLPWSTYESETPFGFRGLLYYSRVYGLSSNSSVFSYKILIGFLILHILYDHLNKSKRWIILFILISGMIVTFNRTSILALTLFSLIFILKDFLKGLVRLRIKQMLLVLIILIVVGSFIFFFLYTDLIIEQLNRGKASTDSSSRLRYWIEYWSFIKDNPYFGNGSIKMWIIINNHTYHAHNVIIQTIATNGVFIALLYFILIGFNINAKNFIYLIPLFFTGLTQYSFLWGVSFMDIFIFTLLFNQKVITSENESR